MGYTSQKSVNGIMRQALNWNHEGERKSGRPKKTVRREREDIGSMNSNCKVLDQNEPHDENKELSEFYTKLYKADENKVRPGIDYKLNLQGHIDQYDSFVDLSPDPLFEYVNEDIFKTRPIFSSKFYK
ncbi:unnamed protein product [Schistosoma margrebowiei]|uniref:Uridylate-specific endoribonuclease n=1 Tax=Schistosoma margrebowiei TaxID=48269 RepID=A0A183MQM9_9TREM|nr:unnamed protein product [Schistosoma margrebowiei]